MCIHLRANKKIQVQNLSVVTKLQPPLSQIEHSDFVKVLPKYSASEMDRKGKYLPRTQSS